MRIAAKIVSLFRELVEEIRAVIIMSNWYHIDVTGFGDRKAIADFFKLPEDDVNYINSFDFSFGQKNIPGLNLYKLIVNNPELIFLVKEDTDYGYCYNLFHINRNIFVCSYSYGSQIALINKAFKGKNQDQDQDQDYDYDYNRYPWKDYFMERDLKSIFDDDTKKYMEKIKFKYCNGISI